MDKKILFSIIVILIIIVIIFGIWIFIDNSVIKNDNSNAIDNEISNTVNISTEYITDDCMNEWNDYAQSINEDFELVSNDMIDENTHYVVKDVDGYIFIYCLDDSNEEILYKKTDISTEYLSTDDLNNLEIGIEVICSKELNQLLENFE